MENWPKKYDYLGAYLMLVLMLIWATRLEPVEIVKHAKARSSELAAECSKR